MHVQPVTEAELPAAADAVGRAFIGKPFPSYWCPLPAQRRGALTEYAAAYLSLARVRCHLIRAGDPLAGIAVWEAPGPEPFTRSEWAATGIGDIFAAMSDDAEARHDFLMDRQGKVQARIRPARSWHAAAVAVAPEHQSRGVGRALMQWGLDRAANDGVPVFLETHERKNVRFYESLGFHVLEFEETGEPPMAIWYMCTTP